MRERIIRSSTLKENLDQIQVDNQRGHHEEDCVFLKEDELQYFCNFLKSSLIQSQIYDIGYRKDQGIKARFKKKSWNNNTSRDQVAFQEIKIAFRTSLEVARENSL